jgi:hypothetical protein
MITARIFRFFRHVPSIRVITRAVSRSVEHLILPLFFFIVFNITTGVIFYFAEPCYRITTCPWVDLFEATFYSVVTMTTSKYITYISSYIMCLLLFFYIHITAGYGDQTPKYEMGRFAAVCVMLFGEFI